MAKNIALQPNFLVPTWWRTLARVQGEKSYCSNAFILQFGLHILPVLLLVHDLNWNPGPPSSLRKKTKEQQGQRYIYNVYV